MRFATALVAGFAALSSAFLIPPTIPDDVVKDTRFQKDHKNNKNLIHALLAEKTEVLNIECPGCPYAAGHKEDRDAGPVNEGIVWLYDVENSLHLEFDTHEHGFQVNGHPIYPFEAAKRARSTLVKATQIRKDTHERSVDFPLNFAADVSSPVNSPDNDGVQLISVEFTILGLNGIPVKVPTISIQLIKTPHDEYVITQITVIPFHKTPGAKTCENSASWSLCRVKAILAARLKSMIEGAKDRCHKMQAWMQQKPKGCKGKRPHGPGLPPPPPHKHHHDEHEHEHHHKPEDYPPHHDHPKHHHPDGHGKHHKYHRVGHMLHQMFRFFVIPGVLGVIGGLAASAIGVLVGQAIVFFWVKAYRNGQRGPVRARQDEMIIIEDEKDGLLGEIEEALPEYRDVVIVDITPAGVAEDMSQRDEKN